MPFQVKQTFRCALAAAVALASCIVFSGRPFGAASTADAFGRASRGVSGLEAAIGRGDDLTKTTAFSTDATAGSESLGLPPAALRTVPPLGHALPPAALRTVPRCCARFEKKTCDSATVLHPSDVQDYDEFRHKVIEGFKNPACPPRGGTAAQRLKAYLLDFQDSVGPDAFWLEFGVFKGSSTRGFIDTLKRILQQRPDTRWMPLHSFDTFTGLPGHWKVGFQGGGGYKAGAFSSGGGPPFQDEHVTWVPGLFNESVPKFLRETLNPSSRVVMVSIDSDLYSSAKSVLEPLAPFIQHGTFLLFDELLNYPTYADHEMKALWEWFSAGDKCLETVYTPGPDIRENYVCPRDCGRDGSIGAFNALLRVAATESCA